jgi:hypothetical protein
VKILDKKKMSLLAIVPLVMGMFAFAGAAPLNNATASSPSAAGARAQNPFQDIAVTGDILGGGTFTGQLDITSFAAQNDQLFASGILNGVLRTGTGETLNVTNEYVSDIPVNLTSAAAKGDAPNATCGILDLTLGPLDLDLLGLHVHLNQVHLVIEAHSGPGQLLGNLLCAIVGLLDGNPLGDILGQIADLLNRIIDLLGTITP